MWLGLAKSLSRDLFVRFQLTIRHSLLCVPLSPHLSLFKNGLYSKVTKAIQQPQGVNPVCTLLAGRWKIHPWASTGCPPHQVWLDLRAHRACYRSSDNRISFISFYSFIFFGGGWGRGSRQCTSFTTWGAKTSVTHIGKDGLPVNYSSTDKGEKIENREESDWLSEGLGGHLLLWHFNRKFLYARTFSYFGS